MSEVPGNGDDLRNREVSADTPHVLDLSSISRQEDVSLCSSCQVGSPEVSSAPSDDRKAPYASAEIYARDVRFRLFRPSSTKNRPSRSRGRATRFTEKNRR